jgi:hypothetical protein
MATLISLPDDKIKTLAEAFTSRRFSYTRFRE